MLDLGNRFSKQTQIAETWHKHVCFLFHFCRDARPLGFQQLRTDHPNPTRFHDPLKLSYKIIPQVANKTIQTIQDGFSLKISPITYRYPPRANQTPNLPRHHRPSLAVFVHGNFIKVHLRPLHLGGRLRPIFWGRNQSHPKA